MGFKLVFGPRPLYQMAKINYTWPGRLHVIVENGYVKYYVTLWLFRKRYHFCRLTDS